MSHTTDEICDSLSYVITQLQGLPNNTVGLSSQDKDRFSSCLQKIRSLAIAKGYLRRAEKCKTSHPPVRPFLRFFPCIHPPPTNKNKK